MDNELFELCKEVYRRLPEWNDTFAVFEQTAGIPEGKPYIAHPELERRYGLWSTQELKKHTPLYTSDYLLEKLPKKIDKYWWFNLCPELSIGSLGTLWIAEYCNDTIKSSKHVISSDTPLKALLKLTIALDDAGVKL